MKKFSGCEKIFSYLELDELHLDGCHVGDKGVKIGHVRIHVAQPLMERLIVGVKLRPLLTQQIHLWLMPSNTIGKVF